MPITRISPGVFINYNGVTVYYTYRNNNIDDVINQYHYTLNPDVDGEDFDVRDLEAWKEVRSSNPESLGHVAGVLKQAIATGELRNEQPTYEVTLVYKGQCTYFVKADNEEAAEELAVSSFKNNIDPTPVGAEYEEIENIITKPLQP